MRAKIALLLLAFAAGCGPRAFDNRERTTATPPPGEEERVVFNARDLRALMWRMARATERVNVVMRRSTAPLTSEEQQEIVELLDEMEGIAARLAKEDARTIHPVLGQNIDLFRKDLQLARKTAASQPPNFFMAGSIAGACAHCHGRAWDKVNASGSAPAGNGRAPRR